MPVDKGQVTILLERSFGDLQEGQSSFSVCSCAHAGERRFVRKAAFAIYRPNNREQPGNTGANADRDDSEAFRGTATFRGNVP